MPTVLTFDGFRVMVRTDDHLPPHVHVVGAGNEARFRIDVSPVVLMSNKGFSKRDVRAIEAGLTTYREILMTTGSRYMAKSEIKYGDTDTVPDEAFEPKNVRVRISIMIPGDVLAALRDLGAKQGKGYQTVANEILRSAVMEGEIGSLVELQHRVTELGKRVDAIAEEHRKRVPTRASAVRAKRHGK